MKFHYMGGFNGDPASLPSREHEDGYVQFKEPGQKIRMLIMNVIAVLIMLPLILWVLHSSPAMPPHVACLTFLALIVSIIPHEILHGMCFKGDAYFYTYLRKGACFVTGLELFSKSRYVFTLLLPNIVFGFIPFMIWLIFPNLSFLGWFGAAGIGMGAGDYMNIFNCLTQVPNGAKVYMKNMNSFWCITDKEI